MGSKLKLILSLTVAIVILNAFSYLGDPPGTHSIQASKQRKGNAAEGYKYLIEGAYVGSGIPYEVYLAFGPRDSSNVLHRAGEAATIPPQFNLIENESGQKLVSPNCLTCHGEYLNGEFIVGLGNTSFDYRMDIRGGNNFLAGLIKNKYGENSAEWNSFKAFYNASRALAGNLKTEARGVNPADKLTAVLIAHRNPETLEWSDSLLLEIPEVMIPTDVPPWWLLKKKNAMFYTGIGRGDFSKFLMASSILTLQDSSEAARIDKVFPDVLEWINSIEAPSYPGKIDDKLAAKGKAVFEQNCSGCHGTYGEDKHYPNLMVDLDKIGTDAFLSRAYTDSLYRNFINWYNASWFVKGENPGKLIIEEGYVAPPLDGIWASSPYFHNASVPDIYSVLNSSERPDYWRRSFDSYDYNYEKLGWNYEEFTSSENCNCYDTSLDAYGNQGHRFGDKLSHEQRMAVIEYLKTL